MRSKLPRCACGMPLHYSNKQLEAEVTKTVQELGERISIHVGNEKYSAQRHYIALHGLNPKDIPVLLSKGIVYHVSE